MIVSRRLFTLHKWFGIKVKVDVCIVLTQEVGGNDNPPGVLTQDRLLYIHPFSEVSDGGDGGGLFLGLTYWEVRKVRLT